MRCENLSEEEECSLMFDDEHLIKRLLKNIITDFSLARVLCDLDCMMNTSLTLIYTARVCGALQIHGHRS